MFMMKGSQFTRKNINEESVNMEKGRLGMREKENQRGG